MDEFRTIAKLWPTGADVDLGTDSNIVTVPSTFSRHAANFVTSMDGAQQYQFLFWNTGRHITGKRHVRWNFSVGGWGVWTATRWYGTPGIGGGSKNAHVEGFTIGGDSLYADTAIDPSASTFPAGAYPNGTDKDVSTAKGAIDIAAKATFHSLSFSQWLQLVAGGDDSGEFVETDTGASMGSSGFFDGGSGTFHVDKNGSALLLAAYGNSAATTPPYGKIRWEEILASLGIILPPIGPGDPVPWERIREALNELIQRTRPGATTPDYEGVIERAGKMNANELKRAKQSIEMSLDLGKSALSAINAQIKQRGQ